MASAEPLMPSKDPWYTAPPGFETSTPGTILRLRAAPGVDPSRIRNCSAVYNILFATTDSRYRPSWAVTTLLVPQRAKEHGSALLSYQIPYNTLCADWCPSYLLHLLQKGDHAWSYQIANMEVGLARGWAVNYPDHEGPGADFANGLVCGHATLDSVRACLRAGFGVLDVKTTKVCFWGFSGGAIASAWAAELQPRYAPELKCAGAVLGGWPASLAGGVMEGLSGTVLAALVPMAMLGVTGQDPEAREYLLSQVKKERSADFLAPLDNFIDAMVLKFKDKDIFGTYFVRGREVLEHPLIRRAFVLTRAGYHGIPQMPLYILKAIQDETSPIADTDELVRRWADVGANILYERNTVGGHIQEAINGRPRMIEWMATVLDGTYDHVGTTVRDVTVEVETEEEITMQRLFNSLK